MKTKSFQPVSKTINREAFIRSLNLVRPGITMRENIVEQSSCFVFINNKIKTFNDEVLCVTDSPINLYGAVKADVFLTVLEKIADDEILIEQSKIGEIVIRGKRKKISFVCDEKVTLPIESVESPDKWKPMEAGWDKAVSFIKNCASSDDTRFILTCIHICSDYMEASNAKQIARYKIKTGIKDTLIKPVTLSQVISAGVSFISETTNWIHFSNEEKNLVYSCRKYEGQFPDVMAHLNFTKANTAFPIGIEKIVNAASVFLKELGDGIIIPKFIVELGNNKFILKSEGVHGRYSETRKVKYSGTPVKFGITENILNEITSKSIDVEIQDGKIMAQGPKASWQFVAILYKLNEGKKDTKK